jgi:hypothetical protein
MTLEELKKRIQALEDIEEIKQLHREYVFWLTNEQWEEMIDLFAEDAIVDIRIYGPKMGKAEITKLFREVITNAKVIPKTPKGGHMLVQPVITIDGDKAKGHWMMDRFFDDITKSNGPILKLLKGRYDCKYEKVKGKWKFSYLKWTHPWPVES